MLAKAQQEMGNPFGISHDAGRIPQALAEQHHVRENIYTEGKTDAGDSVVEGIPPMGFYADGNQVVGNCA